MDDFTPCDRCGARAYVHTELDTGLSLSWCAHHYRANEEALYAYTERVIDLRHQLQPN